MAFLQVMQDGIYDGSFNMGKDRSLFTECIREQSPNPILRIYRFETDTITIGYGLWRSEAFQCDPASIRRPSGGGGVYHGKDLIYTLIVPYRDHNRLSHVKESYREIHCVIRKVPKR